MITYLFLTWIHLPLHPNRLFDRLGERVLLAGQRLQIQAGRGDALVAEAPLDLAGLPVAISKEQSM
jgi:hypothetical protein